MFFNSLSYFLFLPIVYLIFYFAGNRARWLVLLLSSLSFYCALKIPYLLLVLGVVTVFTYVVGIRLGESTRNETKKAIFWSGIVGNVVLLASLKYLSFITQNINSVFGTNFDVGKGLVTIGVSYFVFQAISYLTDIYLEIEEPEGHFGIFAVYMAFFPKLLQGPIERAGELLPQLKQTYEFNYLNMRAGILMFAWGLFKKIVVSDRLSLYVSPVYDNVHDYTGVVFVVITYLYALQIYFDFSGYTDMALGTARIFNIKLTQNFNNPYLATSIADFWRRWHISFSRWILDYIFKPLQMQWRAWKTWGTAAALFVAFLVSGVWHGAAWGFVVWGMLHGIYLGTSVFYKPLQRRIHKKLGVEKTSILRVWQIFVTFNLVCFAWIFFRANSIGDALYICTNMFGLKNVPTVFMHDKIALFILIYSMVLILVVSVLRKYQKIIHYFETCPFWMRWICYYALLFTIILCASYHDVKYIYFKF